VFDEENLVEVDVQELKEDLCAMRNTIRIFKQSNLKSLLSDGEALFPEVETLQGFTICMMSLKGS
jgi:hypothetical protein